MQDINVSIFKRSNSRFFQARWIDPDAGEQKWKSTKTVIRRDAERFLLFLEGLGEDVQKHNLASPAQHDPALLEHLIPRREAVNTRVVRRARQPA